MMHPSYRPLLKILSKHYARSRSIRYKHMEIAFAVSLILGIAVVGYLSKGPHCPKHWLTRLQRGARVQVNTQLVMLGGVVEKKFEQEWHCPKCSHTELRVETELENSRA